MGEVRERRLAGYQAVVRKLSDLGWTATLADAASPRVHVRATREGSDKTVRLLVRTKRDLTPAWEPSADDERRVEPDLFFVFVSMGEDEATYDYRLIRSGRLAQQIQQMQESWDRGDVRASQWAMLDE